MTSVYTHNFDTPLYKGKVSVHTGLYINGEWVNAVDGETIEVFNPANGQVITKVAAATKKDIDLAVEAARKAYKTSWGLKVPAYDRGRCLSKLADLVEERKDEFAALEALDAGKSFNNVKSMEIDFVIQVLRYYAGWADKVSGKTMEVNETKFAYSRREPIGVCGLITPWNFPLFTATVKIAPALATGNVIVFKPSEVTPLSALYLADLFNQAGIPKGVVNILPGYGATAGQAIAEHMNIDKVSFTGSTLVGRKIMEASGRSNLKRVTLELGGKSPCIIFDDADLEQAIKWASFGIFMHQGQVCCAGSRIFVQEGIYDAFLEAFKAATRSFKFGDGFDPSNTHGPLVSQTQLERVMGYIDSGKQAGAKVEEGGGRVDGSGYYVQPTIFTHTEPSMKIVQEEIFGPVAVIIKFKTEDEVIELANDTSYGLAGAVYTQNINRAIKVAHGLEVGCATVNQASFSNIYVPFGGYKQSGLGQELGEYALEHYTNVKGVQINMGWKL